MSETTNIMGYWS